MQNKHFTKTLAATTLLVAAMLGAQTPARADILSSLWQQTGTTAGGGLQILGSGTADLGQLDAFTTPGTSLPGNYVTLAAGSTATGCYAATVQFTTSGNTFVNNGIVYAPNYDAPTIPFANTGVAYYSTGTLSDEALINTGTFFGGFGKSSTAIVDAGAGFLGEEGVQNVGVGNSGLILGGSGSGYCYHNQALSVGDGVVIIDESYNGESINNVTILNSGTIAGGDESKKAVSVDNGSIVMGFGDVNNVNFTNLKGGLVAGGTNEECNTNAYFAGNGAVFAAGVLPGYEGYSQNGYALTTVNFGNAGTILGGSGNDNEDFSVPCFRPRYSVGYGNAAGNGAVFWGENGVYNITIKNYGIIGGGDDNYGGSWRENRTFGSLISNGVGIFDGNGFGEAEEPTDIINVAVTNSGTMYGGFDSAGGMAVGNGFAIVGLGNVSNVGVTNTGLLQGGSYNEGTTDCYSTYCTPVPQLTGVGLGIAAGFDPKNPYNDYTASNISIVNGGSIIGGDYNNGGMSYNSGGIVAGAGVAVIGSNGVTNLSVTNTGTIAGGNNNQYAEFAGTGLLVFDANVGGNEKEINGVTILNEGLIAGGTNNSAGYCGTGADGINITSYGIVRNVLIHNEEDGVIRGGNGGSNNFQEQIQVESEEGGLLSANGGDAIHIEAQSGVSIDTVPEEDGTSAVTGNISIANCGYLIGGDAGVIESGSDPYGGRAGAGIRSSADNVTIYNWGVIQGGHDVNGVIQDAVVINGNNNVLNLNGHSSVIGKITANGDNNVLNLNFTGVSPAAKAALYNSLAAQGVFSATPPSTYTFTVRGVNYVVDPMIAHFNVTSYQELALSPNAKAVGAVLDSITHNPTGQLLKMYNALDGGCGPNNPDSTFTTQALEQLSGAINPQAFSQIGFSVFNFTALEITTRLNNLRKGSESFNGEFSDNTALGGDDGTVTAGFDGKDGKTITADNTNNKRWGYFVRGGAVFGQFDGYNGVPDQHFTNAGIVAGVDGRVNDNWLVGALFNYSHTTATTDSVGSTARADSYGAGLYAGYKNGGWYANTLGTYDHHDYNTQRVITLLGTSAIGNPHGNQYGIGMDGGYDFKLTDHLEAGPIAGLNYVHVDVSGYNETGAGAANLAVASQSADSLRSRLGFHMVYHNRTFAKDIDFATELRAAWQHEFLDDSRTINSAFVGSGLAPFGIKTLAPERDAAVVGGGVNFTVRETATFYIDADVQVGQQHYMEESVRGGVKLAF